MTVLGSEIETYYYDGMTYTSSQLSMYNSVQHRWLRLTVIDAVAAISFEVSSDGEQYNEFDAIDASTLNFNELSLWVSGGVYEGTLTTDNLTQFDNVRVCGT